MIGGHDHGIFVNNNITTMINMLQMQRVKMSDVLGRIENAHFNLTPNCIIYS